MAALLLVLATWWQGAFDLQHWAPLAAFALAALATTLLAGGALRPTRWSMVAIGGIWGLAAWGLLSAIWAPSAERAFEGAGRTLLYAALVTVPLATVPGRRAIGWIGHALVAGLGAIALATLAGLYVAGGDLFLAGRLDAPVGYRNATACLFATALWPLVSVAARRGLNPFVRGACLGVAALSLGLAFATQSRGVLVGLAAGGAVMLLLGPSRVRQTWTTILPVVGVALVSDRLLAPYQAFIAQAAVPPQLIQRAAVGLTLLLAGGFVVGFLLALLDNGLRASRENLRLARGVAGAVLALGGVVLVVGALGVVGNPVDLAQRKIAEFRTLETTAAPANRLGSTGGQRYDLWRVAASDFSARPLTGAGEGSFPFSYYRARSTDRNLTDPHSLPLRLLGETGLVGAGLFALFILGIVGALAAGRRSAAMGERRDSGGMAAAGAVVFGQAVVDWIWLIPGVMGVGFLALALAAGRVSAPPGFSASIARPRLLSRTAAGLVVLAAGAVCLLLFLSDFYVREARTGSPGAEPRLSSAATAERLNPLALTPHYLKASALEDLGRTGQAQQELERALRLEPGNFVTLGLLGDFELRAGDERAARRYYRRALALNPLDAGLQELAGERRGG